MNINGFLMKVQYAQKDIDEIFKPLIKKIEQIQKEKNRRIVVFLAAPAGIGKTTLLKFLKHLANESGYENIAALGIDGFHYCNNYLEKHKAYIDGKEVLLKDIKGHYLTFNVEELKKTIENTLTKDTKWPLYSRNIHNPIEEALEVKEDIVLLEGNYLLLKREKWQDLKELADYTIFITCQEELLAKRLIERKVRGGLSLEEAKDWYEKSDSVNVKEILNNSFEADLVLDYDGTNYAIKKGNIL